MERSAPQRSSALRFAAWEAQCHPRQGLCCTKLTSPVSNEAWLGGSACSLREAQVQGGKLRNDPELREDFEYTNINALRCRGARARARRGAPFALFEYVPNKGQCAASPHEAHSVERPPVVRLAPDRGLASRALSRRLSLAFVAQPSPALEPRGLRRGQASDVVACVAGRAPHDVLVALGATEGAVRVLLRQLGHTFPP